MNATDWQDITSAPKDGTTVRLRNETNGLTDEGCWTSCTGMPDWRRAQFPEWDGEWSTELGKGDMTHWSPVQGPPL